MTIQNRNASNESVQQTVKRMNLDYAHNRTFKTADLLKVLGDPLQGVSISLPTGYSNTSAKINK